MAYRGVNDWMRFGQFWGQLMRGVSGFTEKAFASNPGTAPGLRWAHPTTRRLRYEVFWAHYEANVYSRVNQWAEALKERYELYESVRSLYSPAYRIGEFWAEHVWGGELDKDAGDGSVVPSALPIVTNNPAVRPALAKLWADSNWQAKKDTCPRFGAVLGDVGLMVEDDPRREQVYLRVIHPSIVERVDTDSRGNVKGYVFRETVFDPRWADPFNFPPTVTKTETCERSGQRVVYRTFLDGEPFDWRVYDAGEPEVGPEWSEDYGFVPLVMIQNRDLGLGWGWSEFQPTQGKIMELDMLVSKIDDQIYKLVDAPFLFSGMSGPEELEVDLDDEDDEGDAGGKPAAESRYPALYSQNADAKASPLVAPFDIADALGAATGLLAQIEKDHPELLADIGDVGGNISGEAIGKAREKTERRVNSRRAGYDHVLAKAQMMALSIGGQKRYQGYQAFDADSFAKGELDHSIGERPVFAVDAMDRLKEADQRAGVLKKLKDGGVPLRVAMIQAGYPDDVVREAMEEKARETPVAPIPPLAHTSPDPRNTRDPQQFPRD